MKFTYFDRTGIASVTQHAGKKRSLVTILIPLINQVQRILT